MYSEYWRLYINLFVENVIVVEGNRKAITEEKNPIFFSKKKNA